MTGLPQTRTLSLAEALAHGDALVSQGRKAEAASVYAGVLDAVPDNAHALTNLGIIRCEQQELSEGVELLTRAHAADPDDEHPRMALRQALKLGVIQANTSGRPGIGLDACRRLIALEPPSAAVRCDLEKMLSDSGARARLSDYAPDLAPADLGRTILIACMPKSGSTWLLQATLRLSGFKQAGFANAYVENEQELYLPAVLEWAGADTVTQQHCRASAPNLHLVQAFGMKAVVLVRNLFDVLLSLHDFWEGGAVRHTFFRHDWPSLDADAKLDAVVDHFAPWYVQFYASWKIAETRGDVAPFWMHYEDMMSDKRSALERVARYCDLDPGPIGGIVDALESARRATRFNKGVAGRGEKAFSQAQKDRMCRLARSFPSIDFSPIGL